ncbi:MAG: hypothetical protein AAF458_21720 [Pseudomonadota bacterium]
MTPETPSARPKTTRPFEAPLEYPIEFRGERSPRLGKGLGFVCVVLLFVSGLGFVEALSDLSNVRALVLLFSALPLFATLVVFYCAVRAFTGLRRVRVDDVEVSFYRGLIATDVSWSEPRDAYSLVASDVVPGEAGAPVGYRIALRHLSLPERHVDLAVLTDNARVGKLADAYATLLGVPVEHCEGLEPKPHSVPIPGDSAELELAGLTSSQPFEVATPVAALEVASDTSIETARAAEDLVAPSHEPAHVACAVPTAAETGSRSVDTHTGAEMGREQNVETPPVAIVGSIDDEWMPKPLERPDDPEVALDLPRFRAFRRRKKRWLIARFTVPNYVIGGVAFVVLLLLAGGAALMTDPGAAFVDDMPRLQSSPVDSGYVVTALLVAALLYLFTNARDHALTITPGALHLDTRFAKKPVRRQTLRRADVEGVTLEKRWMGLYAVRIFTETDDLNVGWTFESEEAARAATWIHEQL